VYNEQIFILAVWYREVGNTITLLGRTLARCP